MNSNAIANRGHVGTLGVPLSMFTPKARAITTLAATVGLALIGVATAIYENPFFMRMTAVRTHGSNQDNTTRNFKNG